MSRSFCHRLSSNPSLTTGHGKAWPPLTLRLASYARDCNETECRYGVHPLARFFAITRCFPPSGQHGTIFLEKVKHTSRSVKLRCRTLIFWTAMGFTMERSPPVTRGQSRELPFHTWSPRPSNSGTSIAGLDIPAT
jgi:hypothetical protein